MWQRASVQRILAYSEPVDRRKALDGLVGMGKGVLAEDPVSGSGFVFVNRRQTSLKALSWDRTGFCLFAQRLERGRFRFPQEGPTPELTAHVFPLLLDGIELGRRRRECYPQGMTLEERAAPLTQPASVALWEQNAGLTRPVAWFQRHLFGRKSERRLLPPDARQLAWPGFAPLNPEPTNAPPPPTDTVKAYQRRVQGTTTPEAGNERELRFDASVPMAGIRVSHPEAAELTVAEDDVIGETIPDRLAQRPGADVIPKSIRPVINRKATGTLSCPSAPPAVLERSCAEVSVLAGLVLEKFRSHLPLSRHHQRLADAGMTLSRAPLTQWVHRTAAPLEPIYHALLSSILQSQVLAMEETPIKAGHRVKGTLHPGYFWPMYGDQDEVAFPFAASRAQAGVREA